MCGGREPRGEWKDTSGTFLPLRRHQNELPRPPWLVAGSAFPKIHLHFYCRIFVIYMRGLALFAAKRKFKQISKLKESGPCGVMATSPQKKQANNEFSEEKPITKENIDAVVTFGRTPPFPPVLGPLVALTLLETGFNGDTDGNS